MNTKPLIELMAVVKLNTQRDATRTTTLQINAKSAAFSAEIEKTFLHTGWKN